MSIDEEKFNEEYARLAHAIQSAVALSHTRGSPDGSPKHLRTGVNLAMCDIGSIGRLLVRKGVVTEAEYFEAVLDGLRRELDTYEQQYGVKFG